MAVRILPIVAALAFIAPACIDTTDEPAAESLQKTVIAATPSYAAMPYRAYVPVPSLGTDTSFTVQNIGTEAATIIISLRNADGTLADACEGTLEPGESRGFLPFGKVPDGFFGGDASFVDVMPHIAATQPIAVNVNLRPRDGSSVSIMNAPTESALLSPTTHFAPVRVSSDNAHIYVQNASSQLQTVKVTPRGSGSPVSYILPGLGHVRVGISAMGLETGNVVAFDVEGTAPLAASYLHNPTSGAAVMVAGVPERDIAGTAYLPLVVSNNYRRESEVFLYNAADHATTVTVEYFAEKGDCERTPDRVVTIPAKESKWFEPFDCRFVGTARVVPKNLNDKILTRVRQRHLGDVGDPSEKESNYNGLYGHQLGQQVSLPLLHHKNYGWNSGINVVNMGAAATNVTVRYEAFIGTAPASSTVTLAAGTSQVITMDTATHFAEDRFVGSVTVTGGTGAKLALVANQDNDADDFDDGFDTYLGAATPSGWKSEAELLAKLEQVQASSDDAASGQGICTALWATAGAAGGLTVVLGTTTGVCAGVTAPTVVGEVLCLAPAGATAIGGLVALATSALGGIVCYFANEPDATYFVDTTNVVFPEGPQIDQTYEEILTQQIADSLIDAVPEGVTEVFDATKTIDVPTQLVTEWTDGKITISDTKVAKLRCEPSSWYNLRTAMKKACDDTRGRSCKSVRPSQVSLSEKPAVCADLKARFERNWYCALYREDERDCHKPQYQDFSSVHQNPIDEALRGSVLCEDKGFELGCGAF